MQVKARLSFGGGLVKVFLAGGFRRPAARLSFGYEKLNFG